VPVADEVPHLRIGQVAGDRGRVLQAQQLVDGAEDDQRDERREEGAQAQQADENAVDRAEQGAERQRARQRQPDRPLQHVHHHQRGEIRQREHRAHREVDAADDHHQAETEHDEADLAGLAQRVGKGPGGPEVGDQPARRDQDECTSSRTGIAVSVQRLERISPSQWSGHQR
jgi:hypothetical protein